MFKKRRPSVLSKTNFPDRTAPGEHERVATLSHPRPPRGCRGAERPTPAPSETRLPFEPPRKNIRRCSRNAAHPSRRKPTSPPEQPPGERERVATLSHPRSPRGCRGAAPHVPRRRKPDFHSNHRERISADVQEAPPIRPVKNQLPRSNSPGRAREGRNPLAPPSPEGV